MAQAVPAQRTSGRPASAQKGTARPPRMPAVDGLRGVAVAAVIGIHAHWLPGGWVGVDVFFTLSGFLITLLLLRERQATGRIALAAFFRRRAARLLPALLVLLAATVCAVLVLRPDMRSTLATPVLLGATFSMDWGLLAFPSARTAAPLEHLWSLGVEEKFYLLWAPLLAILVRSRWAVRAVVWAAGMAAVLSAGLAVSHAGTAEASYARVYWSFDTRVQALLIGALVAGLFVSGKLEPFARRVVRPAAALAAIVLVAVCATGVMGPVAMVRGGLTLVAVCTGVLIAHIALTGGPAVLRWRPLRWLGTRSYAAYLWNFPISMSLPQGSVLWSVAGVVATLVIAELSWRLVESRFVGRRGNASVASPRPIAAADVVTEAEPVPAAA